MVELHRSPQFSEVRLKRALRRPTAAIDAPLERKEGFMHAASAPPRHLSYSVGLLLVLLIEYGVLVLYPAYASGLAAASDPTQADVIVPLYTGRSVHSWFGVIPAVSPILGFGFLALFWCVVPLCSLAILMAIVVPNKVASRTRRQHLTLVLLICWSIILITVPTANAFVVWLLD
jgi:hypothetical protein